MKELTVRDWLKRDFWTLLEGFCVIKFGFSPEHMMEMNPKLEPLYNHPDFNMAMRSVAAGTLEGLNVKEGKSVYGHMIMVKPLDFLRWCQQKEVSLSERVTDELTEEEWLYIRGEQDGNMFKNVNQRHRERCRAVAECIWMREPHLTIEDMIQHDDINGIACENRTYAAKTLREWLKDLCPNRQPGRRPAKPAD